MTHFLGIDHPLVAVRDLPAMRERYEALGFKMTSIGKHPWGTSTSVAIFENCLLELMGIYDESLIDEKEVGGFRFGRFVRDDIAEREGISLCALNSRDADADAATVTARGVACQGTIEFGRDVVLPDGRPDRTSTTLKVFASDDLHRLSNFACQQHRRDLVEVPGWMGHPNGCAGYAAVTILAEPADHVRVRARLSGLYGEEALFDTPTAFGCRTGNGNFVVMDRATAGKSYGEIPSEILNDPKPCYLAMELRAPDLSVIKQFLHTSGTPFRDEGDRVVVTDAVRYGNVFLAFSTQERAP